ncbi:hypothetical protein Taro_030237 [Colocasia esculenta]|uniref:Uncharacterized protein n=1 Tax=Colocasia esculenta TaxID=4460 RepID=A0A843VNK4_COLES|nr:hypothetical protein [Colocasia esculenta]
MGKLKGLHCVLRQRRGMDGSIGQPAVDVGVPVELHVCEKANLNLHSPPSIIIIHHHITISSNNSSKMGGRTRGPPLRSSIAWMDRSQVG